MPTPVAILPHIHDLVNGFTTERSVARPARSLRLREWFEDHQRVVTEGMLLYAR